MLFELFFLWIHILCSVSILCVQEGEDGGMHRGRLCAPLGAMSPSPFMVALRWGRKETVAPQVTPWPPSASARQGGWVPKHQLSLLTPLLCCLLRYLAPTPLGGGRIRHASCLGHWPTETHHTLWPHLSEGNSPLPSWYFFLGSLPVLHTLQNITFFPKRIRKTQVKKTPK